MLWILGICLIMVVVVVGVCNWKVNKSAEGRVYWNLSEIPWRTGGCWCAETQSCASLWRLAGASEQNRNFCIFALLSREGKNHYVTLCGRA